MDLRRQRIENEWMILGQMAAANPSRLGELKRCPDEFLLVLRETPAPVLRHKKIDLVCDHEVRFSFARFFPAVPIEAYLAHPVFHPNVHPTTGFVCLWSRFSRADTMVEALCQLQQILTYSLFSDSRDDVMQPEALAWATNSNPYISLPLPCTSLVKPPSWIDQKNFRKRPARRRLSEISAKDSLLNGLRDVK